MNRLRHKLILIFLAATLVPLAAILWMNAALLEQSLSYVATDDLDRLSKSLEVIAREYYRQAREDLKAELASGRLEGQRFTAAARASWPPFLQQFWESPDAERFVLSVPYGDRLNYLQRRGSEVWLYSRSLNSVRMEELREQIRQTRSRVEWLRQRNLPRGFTYTLILLSAIVWVLALASVVYLANRISSPIQELTAGLFQLAGGNFETRLHSRQHDEIGRAIQAFNHTAEHLQQSRDRLVYLTQVASWQMLARKMAHELKNSLTPIRLTVEEILARQPAADRRFLEQAAQVVVDEVESLERRVRAFSEFATEPPANPTALDLNALLEERIQFLSVAHPEVAYEIRPGAGLPAAWADGDQIKGILTNLLENAAEAAGPGGKVLCTTGAAEGRILVEVHDSGPGLSAEARGSLFEPSISFKKRGMGLGLSISRKNALLAGGDLKAIEGRLRGAGFRLLLPRAQA
ncbi:MAG: HAMP domain-containing protein [Acidobacteriia bacterium]|nr:HAMP domain-containing protein [Terriglobia bacterium]